MKKPTRTQMAEEILEVASHDTEFFYNQMQAVDIINDCWAGRDMYIRGNQLIIGRSLKDGLLLLV